MSSSILLARREPRVVIVLMAAILIGWVFLAWAVVDMSHPLAQLMMPMGRWSMGNFFAVFFMWAAMMMAMMLPAAAPMILTFVHLCRQKGKLLSLIHI